MILAPSASTGSSFRHVVDPKKSPGPAVAAAAASSPIPGRPAVDPLESRRRLDGGGGVIQSPRNPDVTEDGNR